MCSRCHLFFFDRFHICRSGAGHNKELKHTRPFALLVIASLFNQVKNVRFSGDAPRVKASFDHLDHITITFSDRLGAKDNTQYIFDNEKHMLLM